MTTYTKRVTLNRSVLNEVVLAVADGMFAVGKAVIESTHPPDAPPFTEGLVKNGGVLAYVNGKKVAGFGLDGKEPKPPRAVHISRQQGVVVIVGWGPPTRFNEMGTIHQPPRPFFTPAADSTLPRAAAIMRPVVRPKLPKAAHA